MLRYVDARFTGTPDSGNNAFENISMDRTTADTTQGGTGVYLSEIAGVKLYIDVNGKLGADGFDYGVLYEVGNGISTAPLRFTRGSIEGVKTAGVQIQYASGATTGELWHPQIRNIEFNGLNNAGSTGIVANGPQLRTPDFSGNVFASFAHVMNIVGGRGL